MTAPISPAADGALSFAETVRARRSYRDFLSTPVPGALIRQVLEDAQFAPSNCNTQPWTVHIVSGAKRQALSAALLRAFQANHFSPDFSWDETAFEGSYDTRRREQGKLYYSSLGIAREDTEGRRRAIELNMAFFNAPHVALLFMPYVGDSVRVAGDLGMYGQTFLLALTARGLGGVPQTVLGLFADTIRQTLGVPDDLALLFGVSFGYPNIEAPANQARIGRGPLNESVVFHD